MITRANTTITVFRGSSFDPIYGDEIDSDTVVASGVRVSIIEQTVYAQTEITTLPRSHRLAKMRCTPGIDIKQNDRILDERTGDKWTIVQISARGNPVYSQDVRVDLEMMS